MPHQGLALEVVRIRTRESLTRHETAQLILRGARGCGFPEPAAVLAEIALNPGDERLGVFVGMAGGEPCAVCITQLPVSAFMLSPIVVLAYSQRAPAALVRLIGQRMRAWLLEAGHARAISLNLRHTDRAYMRGLAHFGVPERVGGVIAFQLRHDVAR